MFPFIANGTQRETGKRYATMQWEFHWFGHIYGLNLIEMHLVFIKCCAETDSMPFNRLANQKMIIHILIVANELLHCVLGLFSISFSTLILSCLPTLRNSCRNRCRQFLSAKFNIVRVKFRPEFVCGLK